MVQMIILLWSWPTEGQPIMYENIVIMYLPPTNIAGVCVCKFLLWYCVWPAQINTISIAPHPQNTAPRFTFPKEIFVGPPQ